MRPRDAGRVFRAALDDENSPSALWKAFKDMVAVPVDEPEPAEDDRDRFLPWRCLRAARSSLLMAVRATLRQATSGCSRYEDEPLGSLHVDDDDDLLLFQGDGSYASFSRRFRLRDEQDEFMLWNELTVTLEWAQPVSSDAPEALHGETRTGAAEWIAAVEARPDFVPIREDAPTTEILFGQEDE